jgi:hypothetical protein
MEMSNKCEVEIISAFSLNPEQLHPNLMFRVRMPGTGSLLDMSFDATAKMYPQALIKFLGKRIIKRPSLSGPGKLKLLPVLDCDFVTADSPTFNCVYFKLAKKLQLIKLARKPKIMAKY